MKTLPLQGVRVVDLSRVLAGPHCSMALGDLGADIIKVERAGSGDDTRGWGPPFAPDGESAYFLSTNRNKLSLAADFKSPADIELLHALIADADIVIDNFLPGVLARYGLDADLLLARNARLLWCTISGFGPHSHRPGYDFVVQAESGWMAITGEPDGAPMKTGVALVDLITGKDAAIALLGALAGRDRLVTAADRRIHVTLRDSALAALANVAQNTLVSGRDAGRWGNAHANLVPYQLFAAADRPFVLAVGADPQWPLAARALGLDALASDPELATNAGRVAHRDRVVAAIAASARQRPAAEWIDALEQVGVPCGVVRGVEDALKEAVERGDASARTGIAPQGHGRVRYQPPLLDAHGALIRNHHWSAFHHVPILPVRPA
ncbi:CaiB/BaiF CoA transferase family protein [Gemmatimonas groenlandica]|uniref:CoA transferase n=1 Tax=Gemmatimonas groenlandica TaxID=2732249 RepID=A0A6M4INK3_9BACT|nr:CoA transferase [Gemmatimonas groenlandica]QJR36300.1 CoA transferase [Gemmatimonas groenlandica]